jgi:hypothetical protein
MFELVLPLYNYDGRINFHIWVINIKSQMKTLSYFWNKEIIHQNGVLEKNNALRNRMWNVSAILAL